MRDQKENRILLEHDKPIRFGEEGERGVRLRPDGSAELVDVVEAGEDALIVHDEHTSRRAWPRRWRGYRTRRHGPTPIGVFRDIERPAYDRLMEEQIETARSEQGEGDLTELLHAGDTWTIG